MMPVTAQPAQKQITYICFCGGKGNNMIEITVEPQAIYLNEVSEVNLYIKNVGPTLCTNIYLKFQLTPTGLRLKAKNEVHIPILAINEVYTHLLSIEALKQGEFRLEVTYFSYLANGRTCRPQLPTQVLKVIELPVITSPILENYQSHIDRQKFSNDKIVFQATDSYTGKSEIPVNVILFLTANPVDKPRLQLEEEVRAIDQAMQQGTFRNQFDLRPQFALQLDDLQERLLRYQPKIVHFSGHGSTQRELQVQGKDGRSVAIPTKALSNLFRVLNDNIRCVVLNACYSAHQAEAIAEHIGCVIGISDAITDAASIQFATAFYRALAFGRTVKTAFELGKSQLALYGLSDTDQPQLLGRSDPEKVIFVEKL